MPAVAAVVEAVLLVVDGSMVVVEAVGRFCNVDEGRVFCKSGNKEYSCHSRLHTRDILPCNG